MLNHSWTSRLSAHRTSLVCFLTKGKEEIQNLIYSVFFSLAVGNCLHWWHTSNANTYWRLGLNLCSYCLFRAILVFMPDLSVPLAPFPPLILISCSEIHRPCTASAPAGRKGMDLAFCSTESKQWATRTQLEIPGAIILERQPEEGEKQLLIYSQGVREILRSAAPRYNWEYLTRPRKKPGRLLTSASHHTCC